MGAPHRNLAHVLLAPFLQPIVRLEGAPGEGQAELPVEVAVNSSGRRSRRSGENSRSEGRPVAEALLCDAVAAARRACRGGGEVAPAGR